MRLFRNNPLLASGVASRASDGQTEAQELVLQSVSKKFVLGTKSVHVLEDVNLRIASGEFVTVVGPSGCGKTTLMHLVGGFETASSGQLYVGDHSIDRPGPDRGMVFQEATLFPWRTVEGNIAWPLCIRKFSKKARRQEVERLIELVGLTGFEASYPNELSGGMRQRVGIARTLAMSPQILLMDEPFGALDAQTRELMQRELLKLWHRIGLTVLFITHDISEAIFLADRVLIMGTKPGRIVQDCRIELPRPRGVDTPFSTQAREYQSHIRKLIGAEKNRGLAQNVHE